MIFTLTDRQYNVLDIYDTDDYLIGVYTGYIIKSLDINVRKENDRASHWIDGNYIFCRDKDGKDYWFTIKQTQDRSDIPHKTLVAYTGTLDILNEDANPVTLPSAAQPFDYYFDKIFFDTGIRLGRNDILHLNRRLEFASENVSNVQMLQYVLNAFNNAEAELVVTMSNGVPSDVRLDVYERIGNIDAQTLLSDEDDTLKPLIRYGDITDLATCLNPVGYDENGEPITLIGKYYEELDADGNILYYSPTNSPRIFSVEARKNYYVQIPGKLNGEFDGYINRRYESESTTRDALWSAGLTQLKKIDHPIVEYEANGIINCGPGDEVHIVSNLMKPPVRVSARVMEYKFNEDDPSRNEYLFGNYRELDTQIDNFSKIIEQLRKLVVYISSIDIDYALSSNGLEPPLDGWSDSYTPPSVGSWLWVRTTTNMSDGSSTVAYTVSRVGKDGADGESGEDGYTPIKGVDYFDGVDGLDGKSSHLHIRYSKNSNGNPMTSDPTGAVYTGYATNNSETAPSSYTSYTWQRTLGEEGVGIPGENGTDGKSSYLHIKYSNDGGQTFTANNGENVGSWIGTYVDFVEADSSNVSAYKWNKVEGPTGPQGPQGPTGQQGPQGPQGPTGPDGLNAISGYLTNEAMIVPANSSGTVSSWSSANGYFRIMDGNTQTSSGIVFSKVSEVGMTSTINASTGYYSVTAMSADVGTATYKAVYKGVTVEKLAVIVKNKQGPIGATGSTGQQGLPGANGIGISSTVVQYKAHTSGTTAPPDPWSSTVPTVSANQYLWTRTVITYDDNTTTTMYSVGLMGAQGPKGATGSTGATGATGNGILSTTLHYVQSTSGTTIPSSGWSTDIPTVTAGNYLWTRTTFNMTNGSKSYTYSVGRMGEPTGVTVSPTAPTSPFTGMLWRNTGTSGGRITGATYRWTGSIWELYIFHAANISAETISAISANLGTVTAGKIIASGNGFTINLDTGEIMIHGAGGTGTYLRGELFEQWASTHIGSGLHNGIASDSEGFHIREKNVSTSTITQSTFVHSSGYLYMDTPGWFRMLKDLQLPRDKWVWSYDLSDRHVRTVGRGADGWVHINPDSSGSTKTHGVAEFSSTVSVGTELTIGGRPVHSYGNNVNGHWLKYYDGTMICWGRDERTVNVNIANGAIFRSGEIWYNFPNTFTGPVPVVSITAFDAMTVLMQKMPSTNFKVMLYKGTSAPGLATAISWQAVGRWY